jgi:hypothetical protein
VEDLKWRKSRYSIGNGACLEVRRVRGHIEVRDSKDPHGTVLVYTCEAWQTFINKKKKIKRKADFDLSS